MPRPAKQPVGTINLLPSSTLILDDGAYTIKAGFAPSSPSTSTDQTLMRCHNVPNALCRTRDRRTYVASQIDNQISHWSEATFRRPVERGQLVNWETQKEIWDYSFFDEKTASRDLLVKDAADITLILSEAPNTMPALQKNADEIIMEEWGFGGYARVVGASMNAYNDLHPLLGDRFVRATPPDAHSLPLECLLVIDSGFSCTTVTPLYNGQPLQRAIRRLDLGGKHITNLLREMISVRYFDLHQDVKVVNDIKEDVCFVSQDFKHDMEKTWKGNQSRQKDVQVQPVSPVVNESDDMEIDGALKSQGDSSSDPDLRIDYVLPDGVHLKRGFARQHDAAASLARKRKLGTEPILTDELTMTLASERFTAPEVIFSPSDVGLTQPGLAQCVMQSLSVLPPAIQATMLANVLVVGGNVKLPGFVERLQAEIRALSPVEYVVRVRQMDDPITSTWLGGARMAGNREFVRKIGVSREEYFEHGILWVGRKLAGWTNG